MLLHGYYKKLAVQWLNEALFFVSSFVVADSLVLRNRQLLVAAKRYPPLEKSPPHIYTHLVFANSQTLPKKPKEYKFSHRSQTVNKFGEQFQGITKKTNYI